MIYVNKHKKLLSSDILSHILISKPNINLKKNFRVVIYDAIVIDNIIDNWFPSVIQQALMLMQ